MFPAWAHVETPHFWAGLLCVSRDLTPYAGKRTLFVGPYDGKFNVDRGQVLEEAFDARRRQLRI